MKKKTRTVQVKIEIPVLDEKARKRLQKRYFRTVKYKERAAWGMMTLTEQQFIPHEFANLPLAQKGAREFAQAFGYSVFIIRKPNTTYTFVPITGGDQRTAITRTARAFGGEVADEVVCFTI